MVGWHIALIVLRFLLREDGRRSLNLVWCFWHSAWGCYRFVDVRDVRVVKIHCWSLRWFDAWIPPGMAWLGRFRVSNSNSEGSTTCHSSNVLSLQVHHRKGIRSRFKVTQSEFSILVLTPRPYEPININSSSKTPTNANVFNICIDHELWLIENPKHSRSPEIKLTFAVNRCWVMSWRDLDNIFKRIYQSWTLS